MSGLEQRLQATVRKNNVMGAVAGISNAGRRAYAAAGLANASTGAKMMPETPVHVASVTKPVVAASLVLTADLHRPVVEYLPELRDKWKASTGLTLHDLLSHTAGLHTDFAPEELAPLGEGDEALASLAALVVSRRHVFRPGKAWQYCNGGYYLAGLVLARLRETSFEQAIAEVILEPVGLHHSAFGRPEDAARGHRKGRLLESNYLRARRPAGGLCSTVEDLLTFAEFLGDSPDLLVTMTRPVSTTMFGCWYGLGMNMADRASKVIWHKGSWGGYQSCLLLVPEHRFAVVAVINEESGAKAVEDIVSAELAAAGLPSPWRGLSRYAHLAHWTSRLFLARATRTLG